MQVDQSGENNNQHIGDVANHYYFSNEKMGTKTGKLPMKVCRVFSVVPGIIFFLPILISAIYVVSERYLFVDSTSLYYMVGYILAGLSTWYILPIFFPSLLVALLDDRIIFHNRTILFKDVFGMQGDNKNITIFFRDGKEEMIRFEKEKCAELVYYYHSLALKAHNVN